MHPTPHEQLRAMAAIIAGLAADDELPRAAQQRLVLVEGQLRRLAGNLSARLPFLHEDNFNTEVLLGDVGVSSDGADVELSWKRSAERSSEVDRSLLDEAAVHERNKALRAVLSELIGRLSDDAAGDAARARIAAHLRGRTGADPALNRPRGATTP